MVVMILIKKTEDCIEKVLKINYTKFILWHKNRYVEFLNEYKKAKLLI